jgi:hypothetical protein
MLLRILFHTQESMLGFFGLPLNWFRALVMPQPHLGAKTHVLCLNQTKCTHWFAASGCHRLEKSSILKHVKE